MQRSRSHLWLPGLAVTVVAISLLAAFCGGPVSPAPLPAGDTVALAASRVALPRFSPGPDRGVVRTRDSEHIDRYRPHNPDYESCPPYNPPGTPPLAGCPPLVTREDICGVKTRQFRHTIALPKPELCRREGVSAHECALYEDDHVIPLCLGGSDAPENHWLQLWPDASEKDCVERRLCAAVCAGKLDLLEAQEAIREDWRAAGKLVAPGRHRKGGRIKP